MTNLERAKHIYQLLSEGKSEEAFEKYYHEEVEMVEGNGESTKGKEANRQRHIEWAKTVEEFHGNGYDSIASDEENGIVFIQSWNDITYKGYPRFKMEQVAVQTWKEGLIIHERFYYDLSIFNADE